ncbi:MAG: hypothetical protein LPJ99_14460 [Cyclobacteriaceae bacterium]|nr:hypothetical protein [Cyclobacteriaceae bacterium]
MDENEQSDNSLSKEESVTRIELSSTDTLFLADNRQKQINHLIRYFGSQGEVFFGINAPISYYLNEEKVVEPRIDLSEEREHSLYVQLENSSKVKSNILKIRVLEWRNSIKSLRLIYSGESNILIPEADGIEKWKELFSVELESKTGEKRIVPLEFLDFDFFVNKKIQSLADLFEKPTTGQKEIQVGYKDLISDKIVLEMYALQDAVTSIELTKKNNFPDRFIKFENVSTFFDLFQLNLELINGKKYSVEEIPDFILLTANNQFIPSFKIEELPEGDVSLKLNVKNVASNPILVQVINPYNFIEKVELSFSDSTNNEYAVQGLALYDFDYRILGKDGKELNVKAELFINGKSQGGYRKVLISDSGELPVFMESYGFKSNQLRIISRKDKNYPMVKMPIVFHILESAKQVTPEHVGNKINLLNDAFSNKFSSIGLYQPHQVKRSPSSVPANFEFYLAERDPQNQPLSEKGINRISIKNNLNWPITQQDNQFLFDQMWDPTRYINVFVSKIDGQAAGFANYPPLVGGSLSGLPTYEQGYQLNYPYMVVVDDVGITHPWDVYLLAHELGHFFGLFHSENRNSNQCISNIDFCLDTQDPLFASLPGSFALACDGKKVLPTDFLFLGGMRNSFTFDQRERMRNVLEFNPFLPKNLSNGKVDFQKGILNPSIIPVN